MKNTLRAALLPLVLALAIPAAAAPAPPRAPAPAVTVKRIVEGIRAGNGAYAHLTRLCDDVGHRLSGSPQLEKAVEWAVATMRADGLENVRTEPVMVRRWIRGAESATLLEPRETPLHILGLGNSVGTPPEGVTAEVVLARSLADFEALGEKVKGRIVLFGNAMPAFDARKGTGYGETVGFRLRGPKMAAEKGAVGVLIRSVTAHSLGSPHTGVTLYGDSKVRIPGAALSVEDAELVARLIEGGRKVVVRLKMEARDAGEVPSANVIGELRGRELPDEFVVLGGHLDSWDVGQGAHDDGAGVVMAMEAVAALKRLDLRPRRTLRVVLWTNEENGGAGADQYAEDHRAELDRHVAAIESDMGGFKPRGFGVAMADKAAEARAVQSLGKLTALLKPLGATTVLPDMAGADVGALVEKGVPGMLLLVDESKYFDYHHSAADTLDKVDPAALTEATAAMAAMGWLLAETPARLDAAPAGKSARPAQGVKAAGGPAEKGKR
jgi:carboxypeptidase Q